MSWWTSLDSRGHKRDVWNHSGPGWLNLSWMCFFSVDARSISALLWRTWSFRTDHIHHSSCVLSPKRNRTQQQRWAVLGALKVTEGGVTFTPPGPPGSHNAAASQRLTVHFPCWHFLTSLDSTNVLLAPPQVVIFRMNTDQNSRGEGSTSIDPCGCALHYSGDAHIS